MKLGVLTNLLGSVSLEEALKYFSSLGLEMVEIGCGGYPGNAHANPDILLNDDKALEEFKALLKKYNVEISALSCHGNPVHPNKEIAKSFDDDLRKAVLLAEKLGVHQINTFSGCPGDCETAKYPNWVTCPWPNDFGEILEREVSKNISTKEVEDLDLDITINYENDQLDVDVDVGVLFDELSEINKDQIMKAIDEAYLKFDSYIDDNCIFILHSSYLVPI